LGQRVEPLHLDQVQGVARAGAADDAVIAVDARKMPAARTVVGGVEEVVGGRAGDLVNALAVALVDDDRILAATDLAPAVEQRMGGDRIGQYRGLATESCTHLGDADHGEASGEKS